MVRLIILSDRSSIFDSVRPSALYMRATMRIQLMIARNTTVIARKKKTIHISVFMNRFRSLGETTMYLSTW